MQRPAHTTKVRPERRAYFPAECKLSCSGAYSPMTLLAVGNSGGVQCSQVRAESCLTHVCETGRPANRSRGIALHSRRRSNLASTGCLTSWAQNLFVLWWAGGGVPDPSSGVREGGTGNSGDHQAGERRPACSGQYPCRMPCRVSACCQRWM